ncbi:MAG TPA: DMT family transporter [Anaerolineales bacterium]|nr:DMT family transporter [Anaerolineales bacterium]
MAEAPATNRSPTQTLRLAYAGMGVGIVALGFSALFVRWAAAPGPVTGFYRMAIASLILVPVALWRHGDPRRWPSAGLRFAALGGAALCLDLALWNTAVLYTSAANATVLANTAPLWVAIASAVFLKERLSGRFWIGMLLVLSGAAAVLGADFLRDFHLGVGDLMAISASLFYAGYYLATQAGRRHLASLPYVAGAGVTASVLLLILVLVLGLPLTGYSRQTLAAFAALGLVTQVLGYVAVGFALGHLPASLVAPTMVGQPVMTALLAIPLLGETLHPAQWIGGAAVLVGIVMVHRSHGGIPAATV